MRIAVVVFVFASQALFAQQRNVTSPTGFGRILFPGGTPPAGGNAGGNGTPFGRIIYPGTGAPAVVSGSPTTGQPAPTVPHPGHGGGGLIPYPVYFPTGNYLQYSAPQAPLASNYQSNSQVPDAPVVIVNQYFRPDGQAEEQSYAPAPVVRETPRVTAENQDTDIVFLIAMKDHMIYAAKAYWVEDHTLNYVTVQGSQNSASLDLVDRELSQRLNRNRSVAFGLPSN